MSKNLSVSIVRDIVLLNYRIWRAMPVVASIWLGIPLILGILIVTSYGAQKGLVDLFVVEAQNRGWTEWLELAMIPISVFTVTAVLRTVFTSIHIMTDSKLRDQASLLIQSEVHMRAIRVPLERLDQSEYYDRLQRAEMVAGTDLFGLLQNSIGIVRLLFELIGLLTVVFIVHPIVGGILAVVFALSLGIRLESDLVKRRLNRDLTRSGRESDYLREAVTKPETVRDMRLSGSMDYLIDKWSNVMRQSLGLRMNANRREIRRGIIASVVQIAGLFGAMTWLVLHMQSGEFTPGAIVIVFQAMRQAYEISFRMAFPIGKIYIQSAKVFDLVEFLKETKEGMSSHVIGGSQGSNQESLHQANQIPGKSGRIMFENVGYQYPGAKEPVLQGIQLSLNPGETVALVGENGAGKSTLVRLLLGLYQPTTGRITWDGVDLKELDPRLLRLSMSAAFQDFVRYETTLRDNVSFGLPDGTYTDADIRKALQIGGAVGLEALSDGLDTQVGLVSDGGRELSGGQWQRLAIARAALRDARLLVLDEPTAALDPQHETELYHSFRNLAQGRTVLFVSHRLGWARSADRIVVLQGGRIIEEGSHELLLASGCRYAAMFHAQAQWYQNPQSS